MQDVFAVLSNRVFKIIYIYVNFSKTDVYVFDFLGLLLKFVISHLHILL